MSPTEFQKLHSWVPQQSSCTQVRLSESYYFGKLSYCLRFYGVWSTACSPLSVPQNTSVIPRVGPSHDRQDSLFIHWMNHFLSASVIKLFIKFCFTGRIGLQVIIRVLSWCYLMESLFCGFGKFPAVSVVHLKGVLPGVMLQW